MWDWPEHMTPPHTTFPLIYLAEVVENEDPADSASGRVQVRVWPMMKELPAAVLPWAAPAFGLFEGGASDAGAFTVPKTNSRVYVFFSAGDVRSPVYFAAASSKIDGPTGRKPTLKMWKSRAGHLIEVDDTSSEEKIKVTHAQGFVIELDKDGNVKVTAKPGQEVQLGAGGALQRLLNDAAATLFAAHVHEYGAYVAGAAAPTAYKTSVPNDPTLPPVADPLLAPTGTPKGMGDPEKTSVVKAE